MARFFNITNRSLTSEQIADIKNEFGIDEVEIVKLNHVKIAPEAELSEVNNIAAFLMIIGEFAKGDVAMIQTEASLMFCLVPALQQIGVRCVVATTRRKSAEKTLPDGSVVKTNVFKHVRFRDLPRIA